MSTISLGAVADAYLRPRKLCGDLPRRHRERRLPWRWNMNQTPIIAPAEILPQISSRNVQPETAMSVRCRGISRGAALFTLFLLHAILAITALGQEYRGLIIGSVTDP